MGPDDSDSGTPSLQCHRSGDLQVAMALRRSAGAPLRRAALDMAT